MHLELQKNLKTITSYVCGHAPTEEKSDREKDQFYERLEKMYKKCHSYDTKIILRDINAEVGKEIWTGTIEVSVAYVRRVKIMVHV